MQDENLKTLVVDFERNYKELANSYSVSLALLAQISNKSELKRARKEIMVLKKRLTLITRLTLKLDKYSSNDLRTTSKEILNTK